MDQLCRKKTLLLFSLVLTAFTTPVISGPATAVPKANALFGFGDSYVDTGNKPKTGTYAGYSWKKPYGRTWPGYPDGRYCDGRLQTDMLAEVLGLPTPTPFANSGIENTSQGINFAIGGSGVTYAYGVPPLGSQVDEFELTVQNGMFSFSFLAKSIGLVSVVGNDYGASNYTFQELPVIIEQVLEGLLLNLRKLYNLGLRNILVASLPPVGCLPAQTIANNFTSCITDVGFLVDWHNQLLQTGVDELNQLPSANIVILDQTNLFQYIMNGSKGFGIDAVLAPCCKGITIHKSCGDVDGEGNPLYTVCDDPSTHFFWDSLHPTQSTWEIAYKLYKTKGFIIGSATLPLWIYETSLSNETAPPPTSGPAMNDQGALGELNSAFEALLMEADYSEALGVLQAVNWQEYLKDVTEEKVTVFLPNNEAFSMLSSYFIDHIYSRNQVLTYMSYHGVFGYHISSELNQSSSDNHLITLSGLVFPTHLNSSGLYLGQQLLAKIVRPDMVTLNGQVVIHGIDQILIPPNTDTV